MRHILPVTTQPGLEGVLDRRVVDAAAIEQALVGLQLAPLPCDVLRVDLPDDSAGLR